MAENTSLEQVNSGDTDVAPAVDRTLAIVLNRDLLFGSRIRSALSTLGLQGKFVSTTQQFDRELAATSQAIAIAVIDMNGTVDWEMLRDRLAATESPPTLAFGPHVDVAGRRAAKLAGVTRIVSNGEFDRELVPLLDRYRRR
jgi:hypothetical protein